MTCSLSYVSRIAVGQCNRDAFIRTAKFAKRQHKFGKPGRYARMLGSLFRFQNSGGGERARVVRSAIATVSHRIRLADDPQYLTIGQVKRRFGDVSDMWIWRALRRPTP